MFKPHVLALILLASIASLCYCGVTTEFKRPSTTNFDSCQHHFFEKEPPGHQAACKGSWLSTGRCVDLCHQGFYATRQNTKLGVPDFAAYLITAEHVELNDKPKSESQQKDDWALSAAIKEDEQYPLKNDLYSGSPTYNPPCGRGHLVTRESLDYKKEAAHSTFDMTNIVPQLNSCNGQTWSHLERNVHSWIRDRKGSKLHVVVALGYKDYSNPKIKNNIVIPDYMVMALCDPDQKKSVAFVGNPLAKHCGYTPDGEKMLLQYHTASTIEKKYLNGMKIFNDACRPDELDDSHWFPKSAGFTNAADADSYAADL